MYDNKINNGFFYWVKELLTFVKREIFFYSKDGLANEDNPQKNILEELPVIPDHITDMEHLQVSSSDEDEISEVDNETKNSTQVKESLTERLKKKNGLWAILGSILVILSKFKALLVLLKFSKFGSTFISMFVMIFIYAKLYGKTFGIGFVLLLFVHELGHYFAAKGLGMKTSLPIFVPFVGAMISLKELPGDAVSEAKMAIAGPALGTVGALACVPLYLATSQNVFLALAYTGFMLNLFNLIPMHPLDGGRTVSAISPLLWVVGIPAGIYAAIKFYNPILIMFLIMGVIEIYKQLKNKEKNYYKVMPKQRVKFAVIYFGLIIVLGVGMHFIHKFHIGRI